MLKGRVLVVAGSDPSGGAGVQADIKTVTCLGGYAMSAITALTAQNTQGVFGVHAVPPSFIAQQMQLCLDDIGADAIKTGMLHSEEVIYVVAEHAPRDIPLIVDPVMVAKGGAALLQTQALVALKEKLLPRATLITPNLPEAELLTARAITTEAGMIEAANDLLDYGMNAVLLKGGHSEEKTITDVLQIRGQAPILLRAKRVDTKHTHGTGCTMASAIATGLAQGMALEDAVRRAHAFVQQAIAAAPGFGAGHGPLGHLPYKSAN